MSQDIIIYPSGDTNNTNPFILFSGNSNNYVIEMTPDGEIEISLDIPIVTSGLVMELDAMNPKSYSGGTTWYDLSGNGNDSTLYNGTTNTDESIVFDGIDDYMRTSTISDVTSISMWVNYYNTGPSGSWRYLIDARNNMPNSWFVPSNGSFGSNWSSTIRINGSTASIGDIEFNQWFHLYIETTGGSYDTKINFMSRYTANEQAGGEISAIQVYNRSLTANEVLQNYNAGRNRFGV